MGWGRTLLLGDIGNRMDIEDTERDVKNLQSQLNRVKRNDNSQEKLIENLVAENSELKLYLASIIRLLVKKDIVSTQEIETMVKILDIEDGKKDDSYDGKLT
jgi:hypothetical protein